MQYNSPFAFSFASVASAQKEELFDNEQGPSSEQASQFSEHESIQPLSTSS
jgi:hypothetical protein